MKRSSLLMFAAFSFLTARAFCQSEFQGFLDLHSLSPVPFVYQSRVVPGAVITHSGISSSYPGTTTLAQSLGIIEGISEQAKATITMKKNASLILRILGKGGGGSFANSDSLEIEEASITCKSVEEKYLDKLVYTDADFKKLVKPYLANATPYLIESVCWATSLTATETSSKGFAASLGGTPQSCDTPASSGTKPDAAAKPDATAKPDAAAKPDATAKPTVGAKQNVLQTIAKDTVGDLEKSLASTVKSVAQSADSPVSIQGQYCSNSKHQVVLKAGLPVAIALKLWKVTVATDSDPDNKNHLDYSPWVDSNLK